MTSTAQRDHLAAACERLACMTTMTTTRTPATDAAELRRLASIARECGLWLYREREPDGAYYCKSATDPTACHYVTGYSCTCGTHARSQRCIHLAHLLDRLGWLPPKPATAPPARPNRWPGAALLTAAAMTRLPDPCPAAPLLVRSPFVRRRQHAPRAPCCAPFSPRSPVLSHQNATEAPSMTISTNHHEPTGQLELHLYLFESESGRECGAVCTLTSAGLLCELSAHPAAGIQHYPPDQPIASVLDALLAARHAEKES